MLAHLSSATAESVLSVLAVLCTAIASVLKKWIEESFRTRRLVKSIENAPPRQRSAIIEACSQLEVKPLAIRPGRRVIVSLRASAGNLRAASRDRRPIQLADLQEADDDQNAGGR